MLTLKLAYRNLFRNTRRTVLTVMLIGFSLSALILTDGMMRGTLKLMVESVTKTLTGEAQIHRIGYRENFDVDLYIENTDEIEAQLQADQTIRAYTPRVISSGMISSTYNVTAGLFYGIDAKLEQTISKVKAAIIKGAYLDGKDSEILIGHSMAELLEVKTGDRIVLTLSEANTGELAQSLFRISGIFDFGMRQLDDNLVFINIDSSRKLLGLKPTQSHEIAIAFVNPENARNDAMPVYKTFNNDKIETLSWLDLNKQIGLVIEMSGFASLIVGMILFLLASLGVINSMFMSIYERIYEFGVIKAIGSRPSSLALLILCEAMLLAVISCVLGMLLGYAIGTWTAETGIPIGELELSGITMSGNLLSEFHHSQFVQFPIYVILLTLVAALYPARFASKIVPSEALQRSL